MDKCDFRHLANRFTLLGRIFLMNTTITGQVICAGRLKDNNGDEFHGVMIETGKEALKNRAIPLYQEVIVRKDDGYAIAVSNFKSALIDLILRVDMSDQCCKHIADEIARYKES